MPKQNLITITEEQHGQRLDILLTELLDISRSQVKKMIDQEQVIVNGKPPKKAGDTMKKGYTIVISDIKADFKPAKRVQPINQPSPSKKRTTKQLVPKVVATTKDYIIIDKPAGLLVHPTQAEETNTLTNWIVKNYPEVKKVGDDPAIRPGIVHRLDKEASGLMVVARTQKMFEWLKEQFKNRAVEKEYYALVHDKVERDWDEIKFPIARSGNTERMAARPLTPERSDGGRARPMTEAGAADDEKDAHTEFIAEQHFVNFSLLRVIIHTGRMHQIRAHMLGYNHPLVGDPLYFQKKRRRTWDDKLGRLFLHSTKLGFRDLDNNLQTFDSPLPKELKTFLALLA